MNGAGYVRLPRAVWTDPDLLPAPFSEREAWLWMHSAAALGLFAAPVAGNVDVNFSVSSGTFGRPGVVAVHVPLAA